jgi:hypothetical protein
MIDKIIKHINSQFCLRADPLPHLAFPDLSLIVGACLDILRVRELSWDPGNMGAKENSCGNPDSLREEENPGTLPARDTCSL